MNHDVLTFVELNQRLNLGNDSYKPGIILDKGIYEVIEWSHQDQTHPEYKSDYVDLINMDTHERIHFVMCHPEKYYHLFTVHTEFVPILN